jgi:ComF family protein
MNKKSSLSTLFTMLKDLQSLFFPPICLACKGPVAGEDILICATCQASLPFTTHHLQKDNRMEQRFWGRIKVERATAFLQFQKGGSVQNLLHFLKYEHREDLGKYLGNWYGRELKETDIFINIDYVIPVPIHKERLKKRGYNQIDQFSRCIAFQIGKEYRSDLLVRVKNSSTQINRSKEERFSHLERAFMWQKPEDMEGKHILIIDDIMTTGATFESCCYPLKSINGVKISICTLAIAE